MGEVVNVVVALAVIVFLFRWATSNLVRCADNESPGDRSTRVALGFRPKDVTPDMVDTVANMFPDIPRDNIRYDLLRTGSVQTTSNKILERGFLDAPPPAYFRIYTRENDQGAQAGAAGRQSGSSRKGPSLISRYKLDTQLVDDAKIDEPQEAGGKAVWEDTPEKREASLQQRKAQMILAARKRLLAQQEREAAELASSS
ncbi:hypothetical protein BD410DRAFT_366329 [Rickenella mellea]|uniref:CUE domain-containing protein n=1 Tax=Rickenella mellea TaxID=50990 RepID=A0A4Y7Q109_9AGAM|nr:hypothetical protein BD410DRAFT_366329 [Rickenella mellea]